MSARFACGMGGRSARVALASCGWLWLATLAGCGGSGDPFAYVKVQGSVKYADGTLIDAPSVRLKFIPQDAKSTDPKMTPPIGSAEVKPDGTFDSITSHTPNDGLVPGKHKVLVDTISKNEMPLRILDPKYNDVNKTPLMVDTANPDSFNLIVEKPTKPAGAKGR